MPTSILVYGSEEVLIRTRTMVLRRAGYQVFSALVASQVRDILDKEPIVLVVLCHSLSAEKCEQAMEMAERVSPEIRTLALTADTSLSAGTAPSRVLSVFDGPAQFVQTVGELVKDMRVSRNKCSTVSTALSL